MRASRSRPVRAIVIVMTKKAPATAWVTGAPPALADERPCLLSSTCSRRSRSTSDYPATVHTREHEH
jgi:hypothetical protein